MIDSKTRILTLDVKKGLFSDRPSTQIDSGGFASALNVVIQKGFLKARPGCETAFAALGTGIQLFHLDRYVNLSNQTYLMAVGRATSTGALTFYYWNTGTGAWSNITGALTLTATAAQLPSSCSFAGKWLFCCGGACNLIVWTGTGNCAAVTHGTAANIPNPNPHFVFSNASRLFLGDVEDGLGTRIQYRMDWSEYLEYNVWNPGASKSSKYQDLLTESDPVIIGATLKDVVLVYKDRKIYQASSENAPVFFAFRGATSGIGCIAPRTLKEFKDSHIFLGDDNVYRLALGQGVQAIGDAISYRLDEITNKTYIRQSFALLDKNNFLYTLFMPKTGTDNLITTMTLDLKTGAWTEGEIAETTLIPTCGLSYHSGAWNTLMLLGSEDRNPYYYDFSSTLDGATVFTPSVTFGVIDTYALTAPMAAYGQQSMIAQYEQMFIETETGRVRVYAKWGKSLASMTSDWKQIGDVDYSRPNAQPLYVGCNIQARYIQFKLEFPDHTNWPEISRVDIHYKPQAGITN